MRQPHAFPPLRRAGVGTLQVNLGARCNQACRHCHVDAGPAREESLDPALVGRLLALLRDRRIPVLDLTGGAPELHPAFRPLVAGARALGAAIIDRCNLTVLSEPGQEDLLPFLGANGVRVVASLPCYLEENVDRQRGPGTYARSVLALRQLNAAGYGRGDPARVLDLVYNPGGPALPPTQAALEADYRRELGRRHGVTFDHLLTLANLPIARFRRDLEREGRLEGYLALLRSAHRPENLAAVMCRDLLSVDWLGRLYDCDFNQALGLPILGPDGAPLRLEDAAASVLAGAPIRTGDHCFACTAGQGSSCGGALAGTAA